KLQQMSSWSMFDWVNTKHQMVISTNHGIFPEPIDMSDRSYIAKVVNNPGQLVIAEPLEGRTSKQWVLPFAMGVADASGTYLGMVTMGFSIANLAHEIEEAASGEGFRYALLDNDLRMVVESEKGFADTIPKERLGRIHGSGVKSMMLDRYSPFQSGTTYSYFKRLKKYPFMVYITYDRGMATGELREALLPRVLEIGSIGGFIVIVLLLLRARIIAPVLELCTLADRISRGDTANLVVPKGGTREIETLGQQLGRITKYIEEHRHIERELLRQKKELEKAKEQAELATHTQSEFLACMSHELRTPLNAVIAFSETLKSEMFGPIGNEKYREYITDIHASGHHLLDIINDILDLSKVEAGMVTLRETECEVAALIAKSVRLVAEKAMQQQIALDTKIEADSPRLFVDELRVKQILLNLLSNAVKFTPAKGKITVSAYTERMDGQPVGYAIAVKDSGIGMAMEDIPKALSKFGQLESALERKHPGTGLGLPLSKELIELHGGDLQITSAPGKGTKVVVVFPWERVRK
ncbi:MAG: hypothetical protein J0L97_01020, partial [Alphaproteobacteria bacterium]|nr:hypothetical protein [Alphaproteobacteria bacterium]